MNHYRPRTRAGWIAVLSFLGIFWLTQPPFVHWLGDQPGAILFGLPFLYVYLLTMYVALILVLIWAYRKGL